LENSPENNFIEILTQLQDAGALRRLILVGSWCLLVYKHVYDNAPEIPALRTTDLDFLVREPNVNIPKINIPDVLEKLGFEPLNDLASGLTKYEREDLEIEFLVTKMRNGDSVVKVPHLTLSAQMLAYMDIASKYSQQVSFNEISLNVPEISAFVLHKILVQPLRNDDAKKEKDAATIRSLSDLIIDRIDLTERTKVIYSEFPQKWRNKILSEAKSKYPNIVKILEA